MSELTIENLIEVIRDCQGFSDKDQITENSDLEKDLGITGDDGSELLEEIEKQFSISFLGADGTIREIFGLAQNEFLFHSECGVNLFGLIASLWRKENAVVKSITVGQLYQAAQRAGLTLRSRGTPQKRVAP
jgi:hypothetical protein